MTHTPKQKENDVEEFRFRLQEQLREDYFEKLTNSDNPYAERTQLIATISTALEKLLDVEASFVNASLSDANETGELCPNCLISDAIDLSNIKAVASLFNHYLSSADNVTH